MKKYYIYIILAVALITRLYHINFPVSGWHSWRQADTAAIAKNFYENGFQILYPQIDWRGNTTGYVESEFHIYPFAVSLIYSIFGFSDMWGRVLSVIFSLFTISGIYLLTKQIISEKTALWAAFIYAIIPLNIYYGRAFMPESLMLMCSVYGIYFFYRWTESEAIKYLIYSYFFITLAVLTKIPTLYLGLPLLYLSYRKFSKSFLIKWHLWIYVLLLLIPVGLWYYHSHNLFLQTGLTFNIWGFGTDKWGNIDLLVTFKFYNDVFFKSIAERHLTYAFFIPFIIGIFIKRKTKFEKLFDWWIISVIIYILIVAKGNQVHEYYNLPFVIPAVVFIAKAFSKFFDINLIKNYKVKPAVNWLFLLFLITGFSLSYLRYERFMKSESTNSVLFHLAESVKTLTSENDLIIAVNDGNPIVLYRCNRKGWNCYVNQIDQEFLIERINKGAKYLIGEESFFNNERKSKSLERLINTYKTIVRKKDYFILDLKNKVDF
jgi:4-amino-4-deoxy-L-arabinose transferase-like glycosyltransferase